MLPKTLYRVKKLRYENLYTNNALLCLKRTAQAKRKC